jgi:hypothetical protein
MSFGPKSHVRDRLSVATEYSPIAIFDGGKGHCDERNYECVFGATVRAVRRMETDGRFRGIAHAKTPRHEVEAILGGTYRTL